MPSLSNLVSVRQLTPESVARLFAVADDMADLCRTRGRADLLRDKVVALLFFEPSSRTMLSFQAAAQRLEAGVILAQGRDMSSLKKGESIEDTIRVVAGYADLIVMRHDVPGSAERAASVCDVPFINAGDGSNEHPTQALVDVYTIWKEKHTLEELHVAMGLDPLQSRAIHSLTLLLSQYRGVRFTFVSPPALRLPPHLAQHLRDRLVPFDETDDLGRGLAADVFYVNRLQEERFADHEMFEHWRRQLTLRREMVEGKSCLVLDPLPRIDEIAADVDDLQQAAYFRQARLALPVRMALLATLFGRAR